MILDLLHVRIRVKLLGLVLLPVVGGGLLSGLYVADQVRLTDRLQKLRSATSLSASVGDLVHAMQAEASATAMNLGSREIRSQGGLVKAREETDRKWAVLEAAASQADPALKREMPVNTREGARLWGLRRWAEKPGGNQDLIEGYSREIQTLLQVQNRLMLPSAGTPLEARFQTFSTLLHAKELAGLEGALVSNVLSHGASDPGFQERLLGLVDAEKAQGEAFLATAPEPLKAEFQQVIAGPDADVIQRIRSLVVAGLLNQDADLWARSIEERQQALKRVQDNMSLGLLTDASNLESRARTRGRMLMFAFSLFGLAVLLWTWRATELITAPIEDLAEGMACMKNGDLRVQLPIHSYDETGRMTESFNAMSAHLRGLATALQGHANQISSGAKALSAGTGQVSAASLQLAKSSKSQREASEEVFNAVTQLQASIVQVRVSLNAVIDGGRGATALVRDAARWTNDLLRFMAEAGQAPDAPRVPLWHEGAAKLEPIFETLLRVEKALSAMELKASDIHLMAEKQSAASSDVSRRMQASEKATGEVQLAAAQLANTAPELVLTSWDLVTVAQSLNESAAAFKVQ